MREKRHHDLLSKTCCLTVPENFEEATVLVSEKLWNLEKLRIGERERERERKREREREREKGIKIFSENNLLPHSTDKFCWVTSMCWMKILATETFLHKRGGSVSLVSVVE